MPVHREIMAEFRAIRQQMGAPSLDGPDEAAGAANDGTTSREVAEAQTLLQTYRAQIEQCEKLKTELDLIYDAISRTKQEIAVLHGKSFRRRRDGEGDRRAWRRGRRYRASDPTDPGGG